MYLNNKQQYIKIFLKKYEIKKKLIHLKKILEEINAYIQQGNNLSIRQEKPLEGNKDGY